MNNKGIYIAIAAIGLGLLAGIVYLYLALSEQKEENAMMVELAEMDKQEMQNQYEEFALQYSELKTQITNDSLIAQLEQEQQRTKELLEELKRTKANDAAEITRLKKELATLRQILKSYIHEIDSLNQLNQVLMAQNAEQSEQIAAQSASIANISAERQSLAEKVTIAAQLDATALSMEKLNKKGKTAKKLNDVKKFAVSFRISRNITAQAGNRTVYIRILTPGGNCLTQGGTFEYEGRNLPYSARKTIEYNGEETPVTMYYDVTEMLDRGTYRLQVFADGNNIGNAQFAYEN